MKKHITERQLDGAVAIVVISIFIFIIAHFSPFLRNRANHITFGDRDYGPLVVSITGDLERDGIYYMHRKSKVYDLLEAACITNLDKFDRAVLNEVLTTGKNIDIGPCNQLKIKEIENAKKLALDIPININSATMEDLMLIPGIGEKTAIKILEFRAQSGDIHRLEELMGIKGIKEKKFAKLKRYFHTEQTS